jgi:hypothetical protein
MPFHPLNCLIHRQTAFDPPASDPRLAAIAPELIFNAPIGVLLADPGATSVVPLLAAALPVNALAIGAVLGLKTLFLEFQSWFADENDADVPIRRACPDVRPKSGEPDGGEPDDAVGDRRRWVRAEPVVMGADEAFADAVVVATEARRE